MSIESSDRYLQKLGARIRELREEQGLTQEDFDDQSKLGVTSRALQNIEAGRSNPRIYTLYKIAKRLNVSVSTLLGE